MRSKLFLIVLILAMAALSGTVFANLAVNESFEVGSGTPADWNTWGSSGWDIGETYHEDDGFARSGVDCIELSRNGYGFHYQDHGASADATGNVAVVVGQNYTVGAYFKDIHSGGSTGPVAVQLEYRDGDRSGGTKLPTATYETSIPNDDQWHLVYLTYETPATTELITITVGSGGGDSTYLYDDVWFDTHPPGLASNPDPATDSKVQAPGTVDLKWENQTAQTCTVYWNDGSADVNDLNFQYHVDNNLGTKVYNIGTVANEDPNEITGNSVAAGKNYVWRVDVGSLAGLIWNFSTMNSAPEVDAGLKQAKWLPSPAAAVTFQLAPAVSDDGLPASPGTVTYLWTKTAGPGVVTFAPGGATSTDSAPTVTIDDPCAVGDYELTLAVSDGALSGTDTVKIRVHANDTTGLEGRYDMDEGDGAQYVHDDFSGNSRTGDRMADGVKEVEAAGNYLGTTFDTTGGHCADGGGPNVGAMVFHADIPGYVQFPGSGNDPNFQSAGWADFRDEVSLAAWIKVDTANGGWDDNWECVINKGEGSYRLHRNAGGDSIQLTVNIGESESIAAGTTAVNDGEWHHVMGTYDGTEVCIYIDGLEEECVAAEGLINWPLYDGPDLTIGNSLQYEGPFGGTMDEVRVHSIGLPYASDNPEAVPLTALNARSVRSIYRTSCGHTNCGGVYLPGDVDENCFVDLDDVKIMAGNWTECNSIANPECD